MRRSLFRSVLLAIAVCAAAVGSVPSAAASTGGSADVTRLSVTCRAWESTGQTGKASCNAGPYAPQVRVWIECYLEGSGSGSRSYGPWTNPPSASSRTCPASYNIWRVGCQTR